MESLSSGFGYQSSETVGIPNAILAVISWLSLVQSHVTARQTRLDATFNWWGSLLPLMTFFLQQDHIFEVVINSSLSSYCSCNILIKLSYYS